ncbi:MAG: tRNA (adenosine(37)-N6)-threonylcarbamoyltransferase complex ATPase subunit type 1 TsaE [Ruminococcaceae bacterium]|jgi:tRNA threonylcarbamoyladenosine biosynthesis protein TsaE|nr:tRNA (adenosine(37)-N6)-threonylcarbamoyltransferase complex ATPase subunit type 1 TsaE [Oscillospiraceae bacterium]
MKEFITHSREETVLLAEKFSKTLKKGDLIAFFGDLGAGKTAFVSGISKGLGCSDAYSPTFAIVNDYGGEIPLIHFDMYRISTWDDLESTGYFDYLERGSIICVEWSENIVNALPDKYIRIDISKLENENDRKIVITGAENEDFSD